MKYISLENSFIYLNPKASNCWRVSIKSILADETDKKSYFLTKECRAEKIGEKPFSHPAESELCVVVDDHQNAYKMRDVPVLKRNEFGSHFCQFDTNTFDELRLKTSKYRKLDFSDVFYALKKRNLGNIYSKFSFEYQNKNFALFTKVEYLNFNGDLNDQNEYLQPIFGYVPILKDGKIYIGYVVKYIEKEFEGKLELKLRTNQPFINFVPYSKRFFSRIVYFLLKIYTLPIQVSGFDEVISLDNSQLEFFDVDVSQS